MQYVLSVEVTRLGTYAMLPNAWQKRLRFYCQGDNTNQTATILRQVENDWSIKTIADLHKAWSDYWSNLDE